MNVVDLIAKKQAGGELDAAEIAFIVEGYTYSKIPDYQMAALLMAIYFRGMSRRETVDLVRTMVASGKTADHGSIPAVKVDKHSTGGVGDKVSLLVAPVVASLGIPVPMISGRGLGHTGGTLDKLESIPGFTTRLTLRQFERQVAEIGCALIGQTDEIVPADQKMYALRDVTGTVRSVPLIVSSILSKKIAEGVDALLLDVKFGRGAVYADLDDARELARNLVEIGEDLGLKIRALLTDMNQPLGRAVGNWLEVRECLEAMTGRADPGDLLEISIAEAALMLLLGSSADDYSAAEARAKDALDSGAAFDKFVEIARRQGADVRCLENPDIYPSAAAQKDLVSPESGFVCDIDAREIGLAAVDLGAGRRRKEDKISYTAGIILHKKHGEWVDKGEPLATLYADDADKITEVEPAVAAAFTLRAEEPPPRTLIVSQLTKEGEVPWRE